MIKLISGALSLSMLCAVVAAGQPVKIDVHLKRSEWLPSAPVVRKLALDAKGNLYMSGTFSAGGRTWGLLRVDTRGRQQLLAPSLLFTLSLTYDRVSDELVTVGNDGSDPRNTSGPTGIYRVRPDGSIRMVTNQIAACRNSCSWPVAVDLHGNIYYTGELVPNGYGLVRVAPNGTQTQFATIPFGPSQFTDLTDLSIDDAGNLIVVNAGREFIDVFGETGEVWRVSAAGVASLWLRRQGVRPVFVSAPDDDGSVLVSRQVTYPVESPDGTSIGCCVREGSVIRLHADGRLENVVTGLVASRGIVFDRVGKVALVINYLDYFYVDYPPPNLGDTLILRFHKNGGRVPMPYYQEPLFGRP